VQARKKHVVLDSLASLVNAHAAFFTQGHQLLTQVEPYMKGLAAELQAMQESAARLEKQLEKRHTYVTQAGVVHPAFFLLADPDPVPNPGF
jgi:hypothetical protein